MWLTNLRIVLPDGVLEHGSIQVEGERIAAVIGGPAPADAPVIDGHNLTAIPGLIDLHGDMLEREIEPRPGSLFPLEIGLLEYDKRLAANGVTTAFAAVSFHEVGQRKTLRTAERGRALAATLARLRPELLVDLRLHARCEITQEPVVALVSELVEAGQVELISLNDHTPGQGQFRDIEAYIERNAAGRGLSREAFAALTYERVARVGEHPPDIDRIGALAWRAVDRGVTVASHDDDTPEKISLVGGLGATLSEFPVSLEAARAARASGMHVVMGAPNVLRGRSHSGNLSAREAVAAGLVDALASDYAPAALLQAAYVLVGEGRLPLHAAIALVSAGPAAALKLHDRGRIVAGLRADLALVEEGAHPRVRATLRAGAPIYWDGAMAGRGLSA